jgi:hypothetical protein
MYLVGSGCKFVEWIQLAQDRIQWWALVNVHAMPFIKDEEFPEQLSDYQLLKMDSVP